MIPRPTLRGLSVVLVAIGLVTTAAGAGVFGATGQQAVDDVSPVGESQAIACGGICIAAGVGVVTGAFVGLTVQNYLNGDPKSETYTQADANETQLSVWNHAQTIKAGHNTTAAIGANQVNDGSRTIAWIKGKTAVIDALNAGKNVSVAKKWAKENVSDYYATTQLNLANQYTDSVRKYDYLDAEYLDHSSLSTPPFFMWTSGTGSKQDVLDSSLQSYTLVNGSTTNVSTITYVKPTGGNYSYGPYNGSFTTYLEGPVQSPTTSGGGYTQIPDGSFVGARAYNDSAAPINRSLETVEFKEMFQNLRSADTQMRENLDHYADGVYTEYKAGDLNISEIPDPTTLAQEFSTSYNSTGYYAYAGAELAVMGTNTSLNNSFVVNVNGTSGPTWNGTLYTDWKPAKTNGTWQTNVTYDPATTNEGVYVATNDGLRLVNDTFVIESMTNVKTGESVNETTTEEYVRQTSNVTLTKEQLLQLIELRQEIEDAEAAAASGGGGGWNFGGFGGAGPGMLVILAGAALYLASRS